MKLVNKIEAIGFEKVDHKVDFYAKWLANGPEALFDSAKALIRGEQASDQRSSQPAHGYAPGMPGWEHVGCLGLWKSGSPNYANRHCLEVFRDPEGKYFLVDQSEHGDFAGHSYDAKVIAEIVLE